MPGLLFAGLWNVCKPVMDPKTVRKVIFVRGDVSDGSANDKLLTEIIGPKWREWCDCPKDASANRDAQGQAKREKEKDQHWAAHAPTSSAAAEAFDEHRLFFSIVFAAH